MSEDDDPVWTAAAANPELVGHEAAERAVLDAWKSGRMPHAWLLTGPRGVGKATLAFRIARFLFAQGAPGGAGSGGLFAEAQPTPDSLAVDPESALFRRVVAGGHADLRVLTKGMLDERRKPTPTIINVHAARRAVEFTYRTAAEGGWKVVIVDAADDLNPASGNAILKALEEPPPRAMFLLVSHRPALVLPTIRSRCRKLVLEALPEGAVIDLLGRLVPETTAADRPRLARLSEGSVGRAIDLWEAGGLDLYRTMLELLKEAGEPDWLRIHQLGDRLARRGAESEFETFCDLLDRWLMRAIAGAAAGDVAVPDIVAGEGEAARKLVRPETVGRWLDVRTRTAHLLASANPPANLSRKQVLLGAFMTLEQAAQGR